MDQDGDNLINLSKVRSAKASESESAKLWTPRDALAEVIDMIDRGLIHPDALVVVWREQVGPGSTTTNFRQAGPDLHTILGLLSLAQVRIPKDAQT